MSADTIAIVLQTPRDQHSSVLLTYQALASELMRQGRQVAIVTPYDLPLSRQVAGRWTPLVYPVAVARWVREHARECDVIVFHSYAGWLGASAARSRGVPAVVAFHGLEPLYHRQLVEESSHSGGLSWRYRWLQEQLMPMLLRRACRHAARVTCLNAAEQEFLVRSGWVRSERVALVAHGVSDEFFLRERPQRPVRTLLFVGHWLPMKGVSTLIDAFELLSRTHPDLRLICAGTLSAPDAVFAGLPASSAVRQRVTVLPRVDRQALAALYREADIFVFPSRYEGFGLALVEAMAAQLPIVTTAVGVAADALKNGHSALVVPPRDARAIAAAVDRFTQDDDLRRRLGRAAQEAAQNYREVNAVRAWAHALTSIERGIPTANP